MVTTAYTSMRVIRFTFLSSRADTRVTSNSLYAMLRFVELSMCQYNRSIDGLFDAKAWSQVMSYICNIYTSIYI
jgi:hypothetical protein